MVEDSQLMFMSHAPGVSLPPRRVNVDESLAGKVLGTFAKKLGGAEGAGQSSAGVGALERALKANQRAAKRKERSVDETLEGASKHIGAQPEATVVVGQEAPPADPSFLSLLPGALSTPLRGPLVTILHVLMIALALLLLELTPPLGIAASLLAILELLGLRTRIVQDACAGRAQVRWPEASELGGSLVIALAAGLWCLVPGLGLSLGAWGGAAFQGDSASSLVARAQRLVRPAPGVAPSAERGFGHLTLLELEALCAPQLGDPLRSSEVVARDMEAGAVATITRLVRVDQASPLGVAARVLLVLGCLAYPMTILAAVRLRSFYAALFPPIVVRAALTVPGVYLLTVTATALYAALAVAGAVHLLPFLRGALGGGLGHGVWIALMATYLVVGHMILAGLLGRVFLSRRLALGWD